MDNKTINAVCGQQKGQNRAKSVTEKKIGISRIPFQVGNSANSATFPRSQKITGPKLHDIYREKFTIEITI